jgi:tRNA 2-selenouridine synthase
MEESMTISVEKALAGKNYIFVDIRSEGEFEEDHIEGALNLALFNNDERARIGTIYKEDRSEAKLEGIRVASKKLEFLYTKIQALSAKHDRVVVYCWRGGMRSRAVVAFFRSLGMGNVLQLEGGYKEYRSMVNAYLEKEVEELTFVVLHGRTGVGKTVILNELKKRGVHTVDLEAHASNSGSVFGRIPFGGRGPTQKRFDTLLFDNLKDWDDYFILESESKRIGDLHLKENFFQAMKRGVHILVDTSIENRVKIIADDYVSPETEEQIIGAIEALRKRLGGENADRLVGQVKNGEYPEVIRYLMESYYDGLYDYSIKNVPEYDLKITYEDIDEAVSQIEEWLVKQGYFKNDL